MLDGWHKARKKPVVVYFREVREEEEEIKTMEGILTAKRGRDFIIKGVNGEYYPINKAIFYKTYDPCNICGEKRITHDCHIIPRVEGGPGHSDNFVTLCPLHHHLFDHSRLSEDEWEVLTKVIDGKMEAARVYAKEVRIPILKAFWNENEG